MPYDPVEDIPDIEEGRLDFREINPLIREVINTTRLALNHPYIFKKRFDWEDELRQYLRSQLLVYSTTHDSIHVLLKFALRKKYYPSVVDAASLCREQIEKIFSIALALSNPHKWVKQSLRGAWRHEYENYLLALEEHGQNPRYREFLSKDYVQHLKQAQRPPFGKYPETLVSDLAKRALKHNWNTPFGKNPAWFKAKKGLRDYISDYLNFPTPGRSMRFIKSKPTRRCLNRWRKEYSYFSQFTHIGPEKIVIPFYSESRNLRLAAKTKLNADKTLNRVLFTNFTAIASACTLIVPQLRDSYGAKHYLEDFWDQLLKSSLLARAIWNIYPKRLS